MLARFTVFKIDEEEEEENKASLCPKPYQLEY